MQLFPALPEVVRGMFRRPEALAVCPPGGDPRERGMFLNQTANYGLSQWEATDRILMEDFNSDNTKTDAALKENADNIAALETAVAAGLAAKGNCQLYTTTYAGTGGYGAGAPTQITFPGSPGLVLVFGPDAGFLMAIRSCDCAIHYYNNISHLAVTWTDNSLSWTHYQSAYHQLNVSGKTYSVLALLNMGE